jgi:hypothetical protein
MHGLNWANYCVQLFEELVLLFCIFPYQPPSPTLSPLILSPSPPPTQTQPHPTFTHPGQYSQAQATQANAQWYLLRRPTLQVTHMAGTKPHKHQTQTNILWQITILHKMCIISTQQSNVHVYNHRFYFAFQARLEPSKIQTKPFTLPNMFLLVLVKPEHCL